MHGFCCTLSCTTDKNDNNQVGQFFDLRNARQTRDIYSRMKSSVSKDTRRGKHKISREKKQAPRVFVRKSVCLRVFFSQKEIRESPFASLVLTRHVSFARRALGLALIAVLRFFQSFFFPYLSQSLKMVFHVPPGEILFLRVVSDRLTDVSRYSS